MDRDTQGLCLLFGFFPIVGMFVAGIVIFARQLTTMLCPVCGARIPRTACNTDGVHCLRCNVPQSPVAVATGSICQVCQLSLDEQRGMLLWNGQAYCRRCVSDLNVSLATVALQCDRFQETMATSPWRVMRNSWMFLLAAINLLFGTVFLLAGGWQVLFAAQLFFIPFSALFAVASAFAYSIHRPTTLVHGGKLQVWYGTSQYAEYPLSECQWFVGSSVYMFPFIGDRGVLIMLPRAKLQQQAYTFVGGTAETLELWRAFLKLAGIKHRDDLEPGAGRSMFWLSVIGGIFALPVCFGASLILSLSVGWLLAAITGDKEFSMMLSFPLFVPGCIYLIFYFLILLQRGRVPLPVLTSDERRALLFRMLVPMVLVNGLIVFGIFLGIHVPLHARIAGVISTITLAVLVGYDLPKRIAPRPENEYLDA